MSAKLLRVTLEVTELQLEVYKSLNLKLINYETSVNNWYDIILEGTRYNLITFLMEYMDEGEEYLNDNLVIDNPGIYKDLLLSVLEQVDSDMGEEIMELNHNLDLPSFEDTTEDEAKGIIETLRQYQAEGIKIQGESIQDIKLSF